MARSVTRCATTSCRPGLRRDDTFKPALEPGRLALQLPPEEFAHRTAHHHFEVAALEPRHLLGEHRHALLPRARHAGDVGAPKAAFGAERLDDLLSVFVDVPVRI